MLTLIRIANYLLIFVICALLFAMLMKFVPNANALPERTSKEIDDIFKRHGLWKRFKQTLSQQGIAYRAGDYNLNPSWFVTACTATGAIAAMLEAFALGFGFPTILAFLIGVGVLPFYYYQKNNDDNKEMMMDLYNTYANLKLQLGAGVYITDSLIHSHQVASCERYKEALGELIINISDKTVPMENAIEVFRNRFASQEIDKLCAMLKNYSQFGVSESYARDIMSEVQTVIASSTLEMEEKLNRKADMVNFAFFTIVVLITMYGALQSFSGMDLFL